MAKVFSFLDASPLSVDRFFSEFDNIPYEKGSDEFIEECARLLSNLNSDPFLIRRHIEGNGGILAAISTFASPQYFVLGRHYSKFGPIGLRVNFWLPISGGKFYAREKEMYSYGLGHNHDFRFFTVGHFGPGYVTDLCEIDPDGIAGIPGEHVDLMNRSTEQLTPGKVIYFDTFSDVHVQHPPDQMSVSINLIIGVENWKREQYEIDLTSSKLVGGVMQSPIGRTMACLDFASYFADSETQSLFEEFAKDKVFERVRAAARGAIENSASLFGTEK